MAIYHASMKVIGRSSGRSAVASAAYRSGAKLMNERDGILHDYTRKGGIVHAEIVAPANAPDWMLDRSKLWNAVETVERRRDAQLARELEIALPRELGRDQRIELVRSFAESEFVARGMIADFAVHTGKASDGGEQPHAHIMLTMRELTGDGFGQKQRDWNAKDLLYHWREQWAVCVNRSLEDGGHAERIDHRTLEAQREEALGIGDLDRADDLDREPEPKLGPAAADLERRGERSERGDVWRAVRAANSNRRTLRAQVTMMVQQIRSLEDKLRSIWSRVRDALGRDDWQSAEPEIEAGTATDLSDSDEIGLRAADLRKSEDNEIDNKTDRTSTFEDRLGNIRSNGKSDDDSPNDPRGGEREDDHDL